MSSECLLPCELVILGSGTALPTAQRGSPGYLLRFEDGSGVLLDAGPGTVRAAARTGCSIARIRAVMITHFHVDHCLDLFALLFGLRNPVLEGTKLTVVGPDGIQDLYLRMGKVFGDWTQLPEERLRFVELEPGPFECTMDAGSRLLRLEGEALRMPHLGHSLGYRIRGEARWLAYSGDTGAGPEPVALGKDVDLYLLEAALPDGSDTSGHLTPSAAGRIAAEARCRRLVLTHFYPETERTDIVASVRREYRGELTLASDQLRFEL